MYKFRSTSIQIRTAVHGSSQIYFTPEFDTFLFGYKEMIALVQRIIFGCADTNIYLLCYMIISSLLLMISK